MGQIEDAYAQLTREARLDSSTASARIERAYQELRSPRRRLIYNKKLARAELRRRWEAAVPAGRLRTLGIVVALLSIVSIAITMWNVSTSGQGLSDIQVGDQLYRKDTGALVGSVVDRAKRHEFRPGRGAPGFLVRRASSGEDEWYQQDWVRHFCQTTPSKRPSQRPKLAAPTLEEPSSPTAAPDSPELAPLPEGLSPEPDPLPQDGAAEPEQIPDEQPANVPEGDQPVAPAPADPSDTAND